MTGAQTESAEQFWEDHYRTHDRVWSGRPNAILQEIAATLQPGRVLDLGCGEGADAVWLATSGWEVVAVDVSTTALGRARAHAATAGVQTRIRFERHDLTRSLPGGAFDLASAQYLQSPVALPRAALLGKVAAQVAAGGLLLVVDHASVSPWTSNPEQYRGFPSPEETLEGLELSAESWCTERLEAAQRRANGPGGQVATVTDNIILVRRLAF